MVFIIPEQKSEVPIQSLDSPGSKSLKVQSKYGEHNIYATTFQKLLLDELEVPPRHGIAIGAHPKEDIKASILQKVINRAALLKEKNQLFAMGEAGNETLI